MQDLNPHGTNFTPVGQLHPLEASPLVFKRLPWERDLPLGSHVTLTFRPWEGAHHVVLDLDVHQAVLFVARRILDDLKLHLLQKSQVIKISLFKLQKVTSKTD
jgi:hypothetical protein